MDQITVLLAAYNGEKYIAEQLDSILEQSVPGIRILVSDDGSTDRTPEILLEYQERYPERILRRDRRRGGARAPGEEEREERESSGSLEKETQEERKSSGSVEKETREERESSGSLGKEKREERKSTSAPEKENRRQEPDMPAPARNFFWLLSQAEGDYLLFSDQDDVWKPDKVEKLLERMKEIEESGPCLVFSDMEVTDRELRQISPSFFSYSRCDPDRLSLAELLVENPVTGGALMMNRALAELARQVPRVCFMHDWWAALCAVCFGRISCLRESLSLYRQHGDNVLGAVRTGGAEDLVRRAGRQRQVAENYRRMFGQAGAFLEMYGNRLKAGQCAVLEAYLALPSQSPVQRFASIRRNGFCKTSKLQTLAQCVTIPREADWWRQESTDPGPVRDDPERGGLVEAGKHRPWPSA